MEGEIATKDDEIKRLNILKQQQQQNAAPAEEKIKVTDYSPILFEREPFF